MKSNNYRIELQGKGGEIFAGHIKEEVFEYFQQNPEDFSSYLGGDTEIPDHIAAHFPVDHLYDYDEIVRDNGLFFDDGAYIIVHDKDGNEVIKSEAIMEEADFEIDKDVSLKPQHKCVFLGIELAAGLFNEYNLQIEGDFDISKLVVKFNQYTTPAGTFQVISSVSYEGLVLTETGEVSTTGKSSCYHLYDMEKGIEIGDDIDGANDDGDDDFSD